MSADIDVLIDEDKVQSTATLLSQLGYLLVWPKRVTSKHSLALWHEHSKESVWQHGSSGLTLELHTQLSDNRALIPAIGMISPIQDVDIGSGRTLQTLATNELLTYLCLHGASSAWFRLKWIADLAALLTNAGPGFAERLLHYGERLGAGRAPAQALLLAEHLFELQMTEDIRAEVRSNRTNCLLAGVLCKSCSTL